MQTIKKEVAQGVTNDAFDTAANNGLEVANNLNSENLATLPNDEFFDTLESAKDEDLLEITSEYFTPEVGEVYNFLCTGTEIASGFVDNDGEKKETEVAILFNREKKRFISASAVLVNCVKSLVVKNPDKKVFALRILCEGKEKKGAGFYFKLKIMSF